MQPADDLYLCLDQGGHASRAVVVDTHGCVIVSEVIAIGTQRSGSQVEHDPDELLQSLRQAADAAVARLTAEQVLHLVAAGLATQRSSIVCWHKHAGHALSPVISWQDTRGADWLDQFAVHRDRIHQLTGLVMSPHYGVSKLQWCLQHLPAVRQAAADGTLCFGPLASFLAARLTDQLPGRADPANASRTLLWDRETAAWSDELLELFGIPRRCLPACVPSRADWGALTLETAPLPLTVVTGDQSAALFAFGRPDPQLVYANLGTGAFVQRAFAGNAIASGRLLASVVYQDAAQQISVMEGTVNGAGSAVTAMADQRKLSMERVHQHSAAWLESVNAPPLYLNTVAGLGSPWWRSDIQPRLSGEGTDAEVMAAVLESIVFLLAVNLEFMQDRLGRPEGLVVTGGLAAVAPLLQRLADISGLTVSRSDMREGTALGLACLLAGMPDDWPSFRIDAIFRPRKNAALLQRFRRWRAVMPPVSAPHGRV